MLHTCLLCATLQWLLGCLGAVAAEANSRSLDVNARAAVLQVLGLLHGLSLPADQAAIAAAKQAGKLYVLAAGAGIE